MNLLAEIRRRFAVALTQLVDDPAVVEQCAAMVLPSQDPKFGDYQANCAMPLGKRLGKPPREIAQALIAQLKLDDMCDPPQIAGPGFVNLRVRDDLLAAELARLLVDRERLGVPPVAAPRTFVVDFASPNVAKPMHVGHIRSTVIGDALCRTLRFLGHRVISDNHVGDWGTQFGMIIYGWKHFGDEAALARGPVAELSRLYRLVNTLVEYHETRSAALPAAQTRLAEAEARLAELRAQPAQAEADQQKKHRKQAQAAEVAAAEANADVATLAQKLQQVDDEPTLSQLAAACPQIGAAVLAETAALHEGDPTNRGLWERFLPACLAEMNEVFTQLGVSFDHALGESFYEDRLAGVVDDLRDKGLARQSHGAMCVFLDGHEAPLLVRKQDGAFLYATTDLATIQYRMAQWSPDAILYVVDHRQSLHFTQLFAAAQLWGYDDVELQHVSFGTVLGEDGRPFKTRSGSSVGLVGLLHEAVERALSIVAANDDARPEPLLSIDERQEVARRVGLGAVKYADLAHNRTSDYKFSYDKMLAMTGNTAAYMQYSYARVRSIFGKAGVNADELRLGADEFEFEHPAERALALAILQFAEALGRVVADYRPNHLTDYLFDLAGKYAAFFEQCPVLRAPNERLRRSRLALCDAAARTLAAGLGLLGIEVVERM